jgi:signal transduction histidine kinase
VLVPADDLDMILTNLVGNAAKYNRNGGSVVVRARHDGAWVRIDVQDTGIGIAKENLDLVLTEFFREKRGGQGVDLLHPPARVVAEGT